MSDGSNEERQYRRVKISRGKRGWGGPLIIEPKPGKDLIYCVTGGGIHPVAQYIADLTGGTPFDGFRSKRDFDQIAVAVIDCGGTARVGVYPMKGVLTVDIHATKPSGPLFRFIKEDLFVSGVSEAEIELLDGESAPAPAPAAEVEVPPVAPPVTTPEPAAEEPVAESNPAKSEKKGGWLKGLFGRN